MFIFISLPCFTSNVMITHLHSTMFIFIFKVIIFIHFRHPFTFHYVYIYMQQYPGLHPPDLHLHSTMFIFIYCIISSFVAFSLFTFHYVYIYICWPVDLSYPIWCIYIPLCLYLYGGGDLESLRIYNLHSTMFIFIL